MAKMYTYEVAMPVAGAIYATIESDEPLSREELIERFHELDHDGIDEWEMHTDIVRGNVCCASLVSFDFTESVEEVD